VQYFLTRGWIGVFIGPIIVGVLVYFSTYITFDASRRYRPASFRVLRQIYWRSPIMRRVMADYSDVIYLLACLVATATMNAVLGNILYSLFGISKIITSVFYIVASIILAVYGMKILNLAGSIMTAAILFVIFYVAFLGLGKAWPLASAWMAQGLTPANFGFGAIRGYYSMIVIVGSMCIGGTAMVPTVTEAFEHHWQCVVSALIHTVLSIVSTIIFTILFAGLMPDVASQQLPTMYAMRVLIGASPFLTFLFGMLAVGCVLSTGVAMNYGLAERWAPQFAKMWPKLTYFQWKFILLSAVALFALVGQKVGVITLISYGYTYLGMASFPANYLPIFFLYPYRIMNDKKRGWLDKSTGEWKMSEPANSPQYSYGP
jgi:uncharacterized membrane protein YkvI